MSWQALVEQERQWAELFTEAEAIASGRSDRLPSREHLMAALRFGSVPEKRREKPEWDGAGDPF